MKNKSFAFLYAVRELKLRKKTFIPVICIAAGVMVLMTNILIYIQSRYTTDLNYYKTNTHLIMPALTEEDAERLENLSFVQSVDRTPDGAAFLCFVRLKDEYLTNYVRYADCGVRVMEELRLTRRAPYDNYYFRYQNYRYNRTFICCALFNARYMELLIEPPVFTPAMMTVIFFSFLMHLASVWLVFSMKVRRGQDEFASMRAMGMGLRQLRQINQLEACGITAVLFIPSLAVSAGSVKIVCILSERLYPDFGMNSLLTFDAPWLMIFVSFFSYLFAAYFAVFMVTRSLKTNSVTELLSGTDEKIPFVEQSSTKLINAYDFKPYEKVELRRTFRRNLPPRILFCLLILFPMLFAGILFSIVSVFNLTKLI